jgi:hypothetical protein
MASAAVQQQLKVRRLRFSSTTYQPKAALVKSYLGEIRVIGSLRT